MLQDRLLKAEQVGEALQVSIRTAYTIMHQMEHIERPFRVRESALERWIIEHSAGPGERLSDPPKRRKYQTRRATASEPDWHIPRRRPAAR